MGGADIPVCPTRQQQQTSVPNRSRILILISGARGRMLT
jgi:hypothetical protein